MAVIKKALRTDTWCSAPRCQGRLRQEDPEFKTNLGTYQDPVSKTPKPKNLVLPTVCG
jgi:hypothetical protein